MLEVCIFVFHFPESDLLRQIEDWRYFTLTASVNRDTNDINRIQDKIQI